MARKETASFKLLKYLSKIDEEFSLESIEGISTLDIQGKIESFLDQNGLTDVGVDVAMDQDGNLYLRFYDEEGDMSTCVVTYDNGEPKIVFLGGDSHGKVIDLSHMDVPTVTLDDGNTILDFSQFSINKSLLMALLKAGNVGEDDMSSSDQVTEAVDYVISGNSKAKFPVVLSEPSSRADEFEQIANTLFSNIDYSFENQLVSAEDEQSNTELDDTELDDTELDEEETPNSSFGLVDTDDELNLEDDEMDDQELLDDGEFEELDYDNELDDEEMDEEFDDEEMDDEEFDDEEMDDEDSCDECDSEESDDELGDEEMDDDEFDDEEMDDDEFDDEEMDDESDPEEGC